MLFRSDPVNDTDFWTIQEYAATPTDASFSYGLWWGRFVPPSAWPLLLAQQRSDSDLQLTFSSSLGNSYSLEMATDLSGGPWQTLQTNLVGTGKVLQSTVTRAVTAPQVFFRLHVTP